LRPENDHFPTLPLHVQDRRRSMPITPTNTLTYQTLGTIALAGAEISAYDAATQRVFTTSNGGLQIVDLSNPANPQLVTTIIFPGSSDVTSVATFGGLVAVAVPAETRTDPGKVYLLDADGNILAQFGVGSLPDMVSFSPDGSKILVVNEGEATLYADMLAGDPYDNPEGSISVIDLSGGIGQASVQTAGFESFNDDVAALITEGVRLFVNSPGFEGTTVAQDLEPEYIAVSPDGQTAWVTLQEGNAIAVVDLGGDAPAVTDIISLGLKDWSEAGLQFDPSDQDGIHFQTGLPVFGMYMPDAIASYAAGGQTYFVMANEGDDRNDFLAPTNQETARLRTLDLDDAIFGADETALKNNALLGRLTVEALRNLPGNPDGDGDVDQILSYGARSFSIRDSNGNIVWDSGDEIDRFVAENFPQLYDDSRSDNKGGEPEGVTIATFDGRTYAFIALERYHSTIVYDITDPTDPHIATFLANAGDLNPESGIFVSAGDSATGRPLFIVSNEASATLTVYELTTPNMVGGAGDDELVGTISADVMTGGNGNDFIYANLGNDELSGGNGDDMLDGGWGDDLLSGGSGDDLLTTGLGGDIVSVGRGNGADIVTDFDTQLDAIELLDGVLVNQATVIDHDGDGTEDLLLSFKFGGGTLILLGVSDADAVDFLS
jgi:DNA-binding beta-propeller fold protein YncE